MTKVAIVSDVHLKLRKYKAFERGRFRQLIKLLAESDANIIIFNGDLLDYAIPTLEEIKELHDAFDTLSDKTVYLLAGNHESTTKDTSTYDYLSFAGVIHKDLLDLVVDDVYLHLVAWNSINSLATYKSPVTNIPKILISHYRSAIEGLFQEEVDTSLFINNYNLILLGDIHSRFSPAPHAFYTGTPYSVQATRNVKESFGYIELILDDGGYTWKYKDIILPQKVRIDMEFERLKEFIPDIKHLYTVHITGTLQELKTLENYGNIIFKKIVKPTALVTPSAIKVDKTFIDALTEHVEPQLDEKSKGKARNILIQIQGDT